MRLRWIVLGLATLGLGVFVGLPVYSHYHLKHRVDNLRSELRQHEPTTIAELIPPAPTNGLNPTREFLAAAGQLHAETIQAYEIAGMRTVSPGKAEITWQQTTLPHHSGSRRIRTNLWPLIADALTSNQVALAQVRSSLSNSVLRFPVDYHAGFNMRLSHLSTMKPAAQWLSLAAIHDLHDNRVDNAQANLMAMIGLSKGLQHEPLMISQLVRMAMIQISFNTFWEALHHPGFREPHLAAWQQAWSAPEFLRDFQPALQMEICYSENIYRMARTDSASVFGGLSSPGSSGQGFQAELREKLHMHLLWPYWESYRDEYRELFRIQSGLAAVRQGLAGQPWKLALHDYDSAVSFLQSDQPSTSTPLWWLDDSDSIRSCLQNITTAETVQRMMVCAIALQRYKLRHGRFPDSLSRLAPDFMPAVPLDFMDGQPLRYRLNADGTYQLYSVGEDFKDDGGDATPATSTSRNWLKGRDWVWPQPATAEEIEAQEKKQL